MNRLFSLLFSFLRFDAENVVVGSLDKRCLGVAERKGKPRGFRADLKVVKTVVVYLAKSLNDLVEIDVAAREGHNVLVSRAVVVGNMQRVQARSRLANKGELILFRKVEVARVKADAEATVGIDLADKAQKIVHALEGAVEFSSFLKI